SVVVLLVMRQIFKHNPRAEFLPVDLMGMIDMKTKNLTIGKMFTKRLPLYNKKKISLEKQQPSPTQDIQQDKHDDWRQDVHIKKDDYAKHAKASKRRELKGLKKQIDEIEEEVGELPSSSFV